MYVVVARYYTKDGTQDQVLDILKQVIPLSRAEDGNRAYIVNQSVEEPRKILFYEQYVDEAAFQFHVARPEFAALIKEQIWPLLESREREIFVSVEPESA